MKLKTQLIIHFLTFSIIPMVFVKFVDTAIMSFSGVLSVVIVVVFAVLIAKSISDPIKNLTKVTDSIAYGKLDKKISKDTLASNDEIGQLARSIEKMRVGLKILMEENKQ